MQSLLFKDVSVLFNTSHPCSLSRGSRLHFLPFSVLWSPVSAQLLSALPHLLVSARRPCRRRSAAARGGAYSPEVQGATRLLYCGQIKAHTRHVFASSAALKKKKKKKKIFSPSPDAAGHVHCGTWTSLVGKKRPHSGFCSIVIFHSTMCCCHTQTSSFI